MSDLHAALLEAITARQERAQAATPGPWTAGDVGDYGWSVHFPRRDGWTNMGIETDDNQQGRADAAFIAAESPDAVLRQCERDLKVLARHAAQPVGERCGCADVLCSVGEHTVWPCDEIVDLAEAYAIPVDAEGTQP